MKKAIAVALAVVMMLVLIPVTALAAGGSGAESAPYLVGTEGELTSALAAGGYIKLTADIALGSFTGDKFVIAGGKAVTLDLNGKTISGSAANEDVGTAIMTVKEGSSLTINDSSSTQTGKITLSDNGVRNYSWGVGIFTLRVTNGTITINGGTIENTGTTDVPYSIDVYTSEGDAVLTVNGGKIVSKSAAIRAATPNAAHKSTVTINGGFVQGGTSGIWIQQDGLQNGSATVTVNGGVVRGINYNGIYADAIVDGTKEIEITVNVGGIITNNSATSATIEFSTGDGTINITGGTIFNTVDGGPTVATTGDGANVTVKNAKLSSIPNIEDAAIEGNTVITELVIPVIVNDETLVASGVDPTYTIIIPAKVDFGTLSRGTGTKEQPFVVSASGVVIDEGAEIEVSVYSDFTMGNGGSGEIGYKLFSGSAQVSPNGTFATFEAGAAEQSKAGKVTVDTANITYSGSYSDTMTFTITYIP